MCFRALGTQYVVLNSLKAIKDILVKKSAITSNRPHLTLAFDLVGWGDATGFLPHGVAHRKHRKFFHRHVGVRSSLVTFYPAEEAEAKQFVHNVLRDPDNLIAHCHRYYGVDCPLGDRTNMTYLGRSTASLILKFSHGYSVKDDGDSLVEIANRAIHTISDTMMPGRFLVDLLPICTFLEFIKSISAA